MRIDWWKFRSALGATRHRLVSQLLLENVILCFIGGPVGVLISIWGVGLIKALSPRDLYGLSEITINANALMFVLGVTVLIALVSGLLPAWKISKVELASALKAEGGLATTAGSARQRTQSLLVVGHRIPTAAQDQISISRVPLLIDSRSATTQDDRFD
jgi:FtsX-like permease family